MIQLRIVVPGDRSGRTLELLRASPAVVNIVHLPEAAEKPAAT